MTVTLADEHNALDYVVVCSQEHRPGYFTLTVGRENENLEKTDRWRNEMTVYGNTEMFRDLRDALTVLIEAAP